MDEDRGNRSEFQRYMNPKFSSLRLSYHAAFHYLLIRVTDDLGFEALPDRIIKQLHEVFLQTQQESERVMMEGPIQPYDGNIEPELLEKVHEVARDTVDRLMADLPISTANEHDQE